MFSHTPNPTTRNNPDARAARAGTGSTVAMTLRAANPVGLNVKALADQLHSFLSRSSAAYKGVQDGGDKNVTFEAILDLSDEIPGWVTSFAATLAPKLALVTSAHEVKLWLAQLEEVSRIAAHVPKGLAKDGPAMEAWLKGISNPLRNMMREFNGIADRLRKAELSAPTRKSQQQSGGRPLVDDAPAGPMKDAISKLIEKQYPELANKMGITLKDEEGSGGDKKTRQWVDEQMAGLKRAEKSKIPTPATDKFVLFDAAVLAGVDADIAAQMKLKAAGFNIKWVHGWANIHNAIVLGVAPGGQPNKLLDLYKRMKPESRIAKFKMSAYPALFKYKGNNYYLVLPALKGAGLNVVEWRFA